MEPIALQILSPEAALLDTTVSSVTLPGAAGPFQVLKDHAPLISSLEGGKILWRRDDGDGSLSIASGFVEVKDNTVKVCIER